MALNSISDFVDNKLAVMPERDKNALKALALFFFFMLLYGVFVLHQHANKVEKSSLAVQEQLFWLRSQAGNIVNNENSPQDIRSLIQTYADSQNIKVEVVENGNDIQFTAIHQNAVVLGSFLERLEVAGLSFKEIDMQKENDTDMVLKVIAGR